MKWAGSIVNKRDSTKLLSREVTTAQLTFLINQRKQGHVGLVIVGFEIIDPMIAFLPPEPIYAHGGNVTLAFLKNPDLAIITLKAFEEEAKTCLD